MVKCSTGNDKGFILDFSLSNNVIFAKVLLVTTDGDSCIDIYSSPLSDDRRIVAVPDWYFSYTVDPFINWDDYSSCFCGNRLALPFCEIFMIIVDVIHNLYESSDFDSFEDNSITLFDCSSDYSPSHFDNQYLPF